MKSSRGFTLIELLVVVSIISLLMSIMLPGLSRAKEQGQRVVCQSNLRQLVMVSTMYDMELGSWPYQDATYWAAANFMDPSSGPTWVGLVMPNVKNVTKLFVCPTVGGQTIPYASGIHDFDITYSANGVLTMFGVRKFTRNPSELEAFKDDGAIQRLAILRPHWSGASNPGTGAGNAFWTGYCRDTSGVLMTEMPHNKGTNVAFVDSHCEYVQSRGFTSGKFGLTVNGVDMIEPDTGASGTYDSPARFAAFTY